MALLPPYPATLAHADDTTKEIRYLKERLKELEAKVARQAYENKQTEAQVRNIAKFPPMPPGEPPVVCKDQPWAAAAASGFRKLHERAQGRILGQGFQFQDRRPHLRGWRG